MSDGSDLNNLIDAMVEEAAQKLIDAGVEEGAVQDRIAEAVRTGAETSGRAIADDLLERAPDYMTYERANHFGFMERVRLHYGPALDGYSAVVTACSEIGERVADYHHPNQSARAFALLNLHAVGCLIAKEVLALITQGFPSGALARARSLHEVAVTASVITEHAETPGCENLPERFYDHADVATWKDAQTYQETCESLGYEPFPDQTMDRMRSAYDAARAKYEPEFTEKHGWAFPVFGRAGITFRDLEQKANLGHLRGHYKWASHMVHPDSKGMLLNFRERRGRTVRLAGPTNVGFGDPAGMTLISLVQVTIALLMYHSDDDLTAEDVLSMTTIMALQQSTADRFVEGEASVDKAEAAIVARFGDEDPPEPPPPFS